MGLDDNSTVNHTRKSEFDIWNLIKRPSTTEAYVLTTRYRVSKNPTRRAKTTIGLRRRRRFSRAESEGCESSQSIITDFDFDKDFPDDFDYDAEEEMDPKPLNTPVYTPSQQLYLKACKHLNVTPASFFMRNLENEKIAMCHHCLGPSGTKACAMSLLSNSTVSVLDLTDTDIGVTGASYIADMLRENQFITDLSLAENDIKIQGVKAILDVVAEFDNIVSLNLSGNGLRDSDAEEFQTVFEETQHLKKLILSHNEFGEIGGDLFGEYLSWNDTIEELDLSWNHLRNEGAKAIAQGLKENRGLKVLDVSWNGFYMTGCEFLSDALQKNSELLELNLNCNRINKECLDKLMHGLKRNNTLQCLKIAWNPLTYSGALSILNMINENESSGIKELDIYTQLVEQPFVKTAKKLEMERGVKVHYGLVRGQDQLGETDEYEMELIEENPIVVLMEFAKLMGFRPIDLLSTFDKDKSNSLDIEEIKLGLKCYCIPLTDKALENLIEKLDDNNDGEIDLSEMMAAKTLHRQKELKMRESNVAIEQTEVGRVRLKLQKLMARKMEGNPTFKHRVESFQEALKDGRLKSQIFEKIIKRESKKTEVLAKRLERKATDKSLNISEKSEFEDLRSEALDEEKEQSLLNDLFVHRNDEPEETERKDLMKKVVDSFLLEPVTAVDDFQEEDSPQSETSPHNQTSTNRYSTKDWKPLNF